MVLLNIFTYILQNDDLEEWSNFFGHFHPVLVHLPIGILIIGIVLEIININRNANDLRKATNIVFLWGAISAIISCIAGYYLMQTGGYDENTIYWHQNLGISVAVISTIFYIFKKISSLTWLSFLNKFTKPILVIISILLIFTGHLGGNLTHGSDYLTANIPQPFKGWLGIESKAKEVKIHVISDTANALAYVDVIQPILENKCYQCHSAEKQKGKLRMDTDVLLKKGGEDGPIFIAGNASGSEIIKRALLQESAEEHMPPKGKPQLTENEIALIHWWIQNGASFDKKIKALPQDQKVMPILAAILAGSSANLEDKKEPISPVYALKVSPANETTINKLKAIKVLVLPLAKDMNLLEASCVNAKGFNDENAKLLADLADQLAWLKLTDTKITDKGMGEISKLKNLIKLHLNHTAVTDKGIDNLLKLNNLEYLNLVGTTITDAGLEKLGQIKSLKNIYLWQSQVTKIGFETFKKKHPNVNVDMGWDKPIEVDTLGENKTIASKK